jgi:hypothetical protein
MEVDDIISYHDVLTADKAALQEGMNYGSRKELLRFLDVDARSSGCQRDFSAKSGLILLGGAELQDAPKGQQSAR